MSVQCCSTSWKIGFVKPEKCEFHVTSVHFLGYIIAKGQLQADSAKIQAIVDWPTPTTCKELQRFLGFASLYRRFIKNYSKVASPLNPLTSTAIPFLWSDDAAAAFSHHKSFFVSAPILRHLDPALLFTIGVDASDTGARAVWSQQDPQTQRIHPCAFFSHRLSPDRNYDMGNGELLAVVWALQEWRHWFEGTTMLFIIWADHKNLSYLSTAKRLNPHQACWSIFLSHFNFPLSYRPGSKNNKPDALSRLHAPSQAQEEPEPMLLSTCFVGATSWEIEQVLRGSKETAGSQDRTPEPAVCPQLCPL